MPCLQQFRLVLTNDSLNSVQFAFRKPVIVRDPDRRQPALGGLALAPNVNVRGVISVAGKKEEPPMRLKIQGGTASNEDPSLCVTCRSATIIKGARLRDEIVQCGELYRGVPIPFPVVSCSAYSDKRRASIREMEEIAWVLRSDVRKNSIGFVPASSLKPRDRFVLDE
jgi:hypothetical protein